MQTARDVFQRIGLAAALAIAAVFAAPSASLACKCAPPPAPTEALQQATAVFEAQVSELQAGTDALEVSLRVVRAWKGVDTETIRVRTRAESAACGIPFEVGQSWLVYANQTTGQSSAISLEVLRCGRSRLAEEAGEDFAALGLGVVPVSPREPAAAPAPEPANAENAAAQPKPPQPIPPASGGCASCSVIGGSHAQPVFGMLVFAALVLARVRLSRGRSRSRS